MLRDSVLSVQLGKRNDHASQIAQTAPNRATHHIFLYIGISFFWINFMKLSHII